MDWKPHIAEDGSGMPVFEWWNGERKITMYPIDNVLLKVWGADMDNQMEDIALTDTTSVRAAFDWLGA